MQSFRSAIQKFPGTLFAATCILYLCLYFTESYFFSKRTEFILYGIVVLVAAGFTLLWIKNEQKFSSQKINYVLQLIIRCTLAYLFILYALSKVYNIQFGADPDTMKRPVGELDAFSLAWIFFAHSYRYGLFLALAEIIAALLLLFRSTVTAGALLFAMILLNIVVIDFEFNVKSMQLVSAVCFFLAMYLLGFDYKRIVHFLRGKPSPPTYYTPVPKTPFYLVSWSIGIIIILAGLIIDAVHIYRYFQGMEA